MKKKNCWEVKKCGREIGGSKVDELGVCPVSIAEKLDGLNQGKNGGRACWAVAGTMCFGYVQGTFAKKIGDCLLCDFFEQVKQEEGAEWVSTREILEKLGK
jgi:hypothetical protein